MHLSILYEGYIIWSSSAIAILHLFSAFNDYHIAMNDTLGYLGQYKEILDSVVQM